jgi:hypothetical protein
MKKMPLLMLLACFCFSGCASIYAHRYTSKVFPPRNENGIHVYSISFPKRPYIEIAEILSDSYSIGDLKDKAAKLGADGIIIVTPSYKMSVLYEQDSETRVEVKQYNLNGGRKLNAIAIKYAWQD